MSPENDVAVQIGTRITTNRRVNIDFLASLQGSQQALAVSMPSTGITQPMISKILSKERPLSDHEARKIEEDLKIPYGWLDRIKLSSALQIWLKFKEISSENIALFNEMQSFFEANAVPPLPKRVQDASGNVAHSPE